MPTTVLRASYTLVNSVFVITLQCMYFYSPHFTEWKIRLIENELFPKVSQLVKWQRAERGRSAFFSMTVMYAQGLYSY